MDINEKLFDLVSNTIGVSVAIMMLSVAFMIVKYALNYQP